MASKILTLFVVMLIMSLLMIFFLVGILYLRRKKYLLGTMLLLTAVSCTFSMFFLYFAYSITLNIAVFIGLALLVGVTMFFAQKESGEDTYRALLMALAMGLTMAYLISETSMIMRLVSM